MQLSKLSQKIGAVLFLFALSISTLAQNKAFDFSRLDSTVEACTDFYQYSNGNWIKNTPLPGDRPSYGSFNLVSDNSLISLRQILESAAKNAGAVKGSNEQLIGDSYATCMDESAIEADGIKPIEPFLKDINKVKSVRDLPQTLAQMSNVGLVIVFDFGRTIDAKNSNVNIAEVRQNGLSLPNRDYFLNEKFGKIREKFVQYVANMFQLLGENEAQAKNDAETVLRLQTRLAKASKSPLEMRDAEKNYNKITLADLKKITPDFDWNKYLKTRGAPAFSEVNVGQPAFLEEFNGMLSDVPIDDWKTLMRWKLLTSAASNLPKKFVDEKFDFESRTLQGVKEQQPRWKRCSG